MVFVEHQAVEAHLLGVGLLVEIAVVEMGSQLGVVDVVADREVHDGLAGGTEIAGVRVLVGALGEVPDKHRWFSLWLRNG